MSDHEVPGRTDHLLEQVRAGGEAAEAARSTLFVRLYDELRQLARHVMRGERAHRTLSPTSLVHELYIRLACQDLAMENRAHFFGIAARAMRQILVEHAREHAALKRGGGVTKVTLDEALHIGSGPDLWILDVEAAFEKLARLDQRAARVAEMRAFGGMTVDEVAHVLGISPRTVDGDWAVARLWLSRELTGGAT